MHFLSTIYFCWLFLATSFLFALHISFVASGLIYFLLSFYTVSLSRTRAVKDWLVSRSYQPGTNDLFANALCDIFSFLLTQTPTLTPLFFHITDIPRGRFSIFTEKVQQNKLHVNIWGGTVIIFLKIDSGLLQEYKTDLISCITTLLTCFLVNVPQFFFFLMDFQFFSFAKRWSQ